jgi:hypothetical protein
MMKDEIKVSEFRRHIIQAYYESVNLVFWNDRGVEFKKRILDDNNSTAYIEECFTAVRQVLTEGEQSKYVIFNCFEMLIVCVEKVRFFLKADHIKQIVEMVVNEVSRVTDSHMCYVLRDVFGYFFEKLLYFLPKTLVNDVYDIISDRLLNSKHKLSNKDALLYIIVAKKNPEPMGSVPKLLSEIYLKTWYRVFKIFGTDIQERIQDVR